MAATAATPDAMIIPASIDLHNFSKDTNCTFNVTGVVEGTQSTTFPLDQVFVDPMTNLRIGVHYPMMDYAQSSRHPKARGGGLSSELYVVECTNQVEKNSWGSAFISNVEPKDQDGDDLDYKALAPYKFFTQSAIIGSQGSGELMIAYPQSTAHTIEVSPELMRMQMRAYLGAAVLQQENVLRIPHIYIEGREDTPDDLTFKTLREAYLTGNVVFSNDLYKSNVLHTFGGQPGGNLFDFIGPSGALSSAGSYMVSEGHYEEENPVHEENPVQEENPSLDESEAHNSSTVEEVLEQAEKLLSQNSSTDPLEKSSTTEAAEVTKEVDDAGFKGVTSRKKKGSRR